MKVLNLRDAAAFTRTYYIFDDFHYYIDADQWTATATDSGTVTVADAATGKVSLAASDGSVVDNDETYLESTKETFLIADNKPIHFKARVQFTEANTDDANIFVGLASAVAANLLVDDGAGPRASGNIVGFYKVDGGTKWQVYSRNGSDVNTHDSGVTAGGASYQELEFTVENQGDGSSNVKIAFWIDGVPVFNSDTNRQRLHLLPITSSTEMQVGLGVKNGGANLETLVTDFVYAAQLR
jgi:hypothetical protein